jgi:hypothetical protein
LGHDTNQLIRPPKPGWLKRTLDTFRENPSLIVSTTSLIVAVAALFLTYIAQARDAYYRELSIRPTIVYEYLAPHFTFSLKNAGFGPAVIKKVAFAFDGKCYDLAKASEISGAQLDDLAMQTAKYFFFSLAREFDIAITRNDGPIMSLDMVAPGSLIFKDGKVDLFSLTPAQLRLVQERLNKDAATSNKLTFSFHDIVRNVPMFIEYCSLSGAFCDTLGKACTPAQ